MHIEQTSTSAGTTTYRVKWRDSDGRRAARSFATARDARAFAVGLQLRRALVELDRGQTTLEDYVAHVWIPVYAPVLAPSNCATHQYLYAKHLGPQLGARPLRELTAELIAAWQVERLQARSDPRSARRALLVLSGILQTAVQAHYLEHNPARTLLEPVAAG
jgi:hypothetical protein